MRPGAAPGASLAPSATPSAEPLAELLTAAGFASLFATEPVNHLTADQFERRFQKAAVIGSSTVTLTKGGTTDLTPAGTFAEPPFAVYHVALEGPSSQIAKRSLFNFKSDPSPELHKVVLELRVGSTECPDWDHASVCVTAIHDLVKLADGYMNEQVIRALKAHTNVISHEHSRV
jgi:hypothetical protein